MSKSDFLDSLIIRNFHYLVFALLLFFNISKGFSQVVWEEIPTPSSNRHYSIAVATNGDIYLGNLSDETGGVIRSSNSGATWDFIGLENYSVYSLCFNDEGNLLAGTNNGIFLYDLMSSVWDQKHWSISNIITINPGFNNTFFAGADVNRSYDNGYTWEKINDLDDDEMDFALLSPDTVYSGTRDIYGGLCGVFRSIDSGDTWQHIGLDYYYVSTLGVSSTGDIYAGCTGHYYNGWGGVNKLAYGTDTWETLSYSPMISSMIITKEDVIYCGFWTTTEYQGGVMHSENDGETWIIDTTGMGNTGILKLVLDNNETLYALSNNTNTRLYRSLFPVSIDKKEVLPTKIASFCAPNPFSSKAKIYFDRPPKGSTNLHLNIYSHGGLKILTRTISRDEIDQEIILIERNNLTKGMYSYTISGPNYYCASKFIIN